MADLVVGRELSGCRSGGGWVGREREEGRRCYWCSAAAATDSEDGGSMAAEAPVEETGETGWLRRDGVVLLYGLVEAGVDGEAGLCAAEWESWVLLMAKRKRRRSAAPVVGSVRWRLKTLGKGRWGKELALGQGSARELGFRLFGRGQRLGGWEWEGEFFFLLGKWWAAAFLLWPRVAGSGVMEGRSGEEKENAKALVRCVWVCEEVRGWGEKTFQPGDRRLWFFERDGLGLGFSFCVAFLLISKLSPFFIAKLPLQVLSCRLVFIGKIFFGFQNWSLNFCVNLAPNQSINLVKIKFGLLKF